MHRLPCLLLTTLFLSFAPARAAGPSIPDLMAALAQGDALEKRAALEDLTLIRWPGAKLSSGTLAKGDEVQILARGAGGMVRVRKGTDFGWVAEAKLGPVATPTP